MNIVIVRGVLSRPPEERTLQSGTRLVSFDVAVRSEGHPMETVPVTWEDPPTAAGAIVEGTAVVVTGRVRRRFFRAGGATQSRTEVVAAAVVPATRRKRVEALMGAAMEELEVGPDR